MSSNRYSLLLDTLLHSDASAEDKAESVQRLMQQVKKQGAPIIENDNQAIFLYQGNAQSVGIVGDMTDWSRTEPLQRIPGTDIFFWRAELPHDARLEYNMVFDDMELLSLDPLNPHVSLNGLGPLSEVAMPGYDYHPLFANWRSGQKGTFENIETHELPAGCLGYPHTVHVYLPPGYADRDMSYPVAYFHDGEDYVEFAQVPLVLNSLIREGVIEPLIAVFEAPPNRHLPDEPNRMSQYGANDTYVRFFADELVTFVDRTYRTRRTADARLVTGPSFGGLIAGYIAFRRPDVFQMAYSQSGYQSFRSDRLIKLFREGERLPLRLYVDVGRFERCVGAAFLPASETDFLAANRRLRDVLQEKGYDFVYREYPEGHTWGNWRRHLIDALTHFFGVSP